MTVHFRLVRAFSLVLQIFLKFSKSVHRQTDIFNHRSGDMELRGGVEIPIALWGGLERRMGTMTRVLQAARYE